jgi:hypothetical protein
LKFAKIWILILLVIAPSLSYGIALPVKAVLRMELTRISEENNFPTYIIFQGYETDAVLVRFSVQKKEGLVYEAVIDESTPEELAKLQDMCSEGQRGYWDDMILANRGSAPVLHIKHLFFQLVYNSNTSGCINEISVIDWEINQSLKDTYAQIFLNDFARFSRFKWVKEAVKQTIGIDYEYKADTCPAFLSAVRDIGKCGTSGYNLYETDPKYGAGDNNLCSEFVSWYYCNEGTAIGKQVFKDVFGTSHFIDIFSYVDRAYGYNNTTRQFENLNTGEVYLPQPGDYLMRTNSGHSMIIAGWNDETKTAAVINGPWPVTIRKVEIQKDEDSTDKEYTIGRVNELAASKNM